jgi:copper chaperone CopZ
MSDSSAYLVPGMHCTHCVVAVTGELERLDGVDTVEVDLDRKLVTVHGHGLEESALLAAIDEAGYEAEPIGGP